MYANITQVPKKPEHAPVYTSNPHINQIQGDTIGLHFAQTTHKGTKDFKIQVLEFICLPQNSERESWNSVSKKRNSGYIDSDVQPHEDWTME